MQSPKAINSIMNCLFRSSNFIFEERDIQTDLLGANYLEEQVFFPHHFTVRAEINSFSNCSLSTHSVCFFRERENQTDTIFAFTVSTVRLGSQTWKRNFSKTTKQSEGQVSWNALQENHTLFRRQGNYFLRK